MASFFSLSLFVLLHFLTFFSLPLFNPTPPYSIAVLTIFVTENTLRCAFWLGQLVK